MNKGWVFVTDCTRSTAPKIIAMTQAEREITWPTFRRYVPVEEVRRIFPYYSYHGEVRNPATGEVVAARRLRQLDDRRAAGEQPVCADAGVVLKRWSDRELKRGAGALHVGAQHDL